MVSHSRSAAIRSAAPRSKLARYLGMVVVQMRGSQSKESPLPIALPDRSTGKLVHVAGSSHAMRINNCTRAHRMHSLVFRTYPVSSPPIKMFCLSDASVSIRASRLTAEFCRLNCSVTTSSDGSVSSNGSTLDSGFFSITIKAGCGELARPGATNGDSVSASVVVVGVVVVDRCCDDDVSLPLGSSLDGDGDGDGDAAAGISRPRDELLRPIMMRRSGASFDDEDDDDDDDDEEELLVATLLSPLSRSLPSGSATAEEELRRTHFDASFEGDQLLRGFAFGSMVAAPNACAAVGGLLF